MWEVSALLFLAYSEILSHLISFYINTVWIASQRGATALHFDFSHQWSKSEWYFDETYWLDVLKLCRGQRSPGGRCRESLSLRGGGSAGCYPITGRLLPWICYWCLGRLKETKWSILATLHRRSSPMVAKLIYRRTALLLQIAGGSRLPAKQWRWRKNLFFSQLERLLDWQQSLREAHRMQSITLYWNEWLLTWGRAFGESSMSQVSRLRFPLVRLTLRSVSLVGSGVDWI